MPFIAAIIGIIIAFFFFIGVCLIIMGGTGVAMNKIYKKQTKVKYGALNSSCNIISIILGIIILLFPLGCVLFGIISN
nr:hypothetical protein [Ruminiclostridium papyrosolvens]